jgi:methyl coenzyme M reductase alpha subunit
VKAQRLFAATSLALLLVTTAPVARADGLDEPGGAPHGFIADLGDCLSLAACAGLEIVSSVF